MNEIRILCCFPAVYTYLLWRIWASLVAQLAKNLPQYRRPGLGRSPGEGKDYPLQYSGLENSTDYKSQMVLWKCCTQYASKFGKHNSGHRTGKGPFSSQSLRNAIPKNAQTISQLHSSHTLVKWCSKFSKQGFSNTWTMNFQMFKLVLEKAEEPEIKLPTPAGSLKKQENSRKTSISALLTMPKPLTVWITINCGKFWKRWEYQTTWPAYWEICMQVRK